MLLPRQMGRLASGSLGPPALRKSVPKEVGPKRWDVALLERVVAEAPLAREGVAVHL